MEVYQAYQGLVYVIAVVIALVFMVMMISWGTRRILNGIPKKT